MDKFQMQLFCNEEEKIKVEQKIQKTRDYFEKHKQDLNDVQIIEVYDYGKTKSYGTDIEIDDFLVHSKNSMISIGAGAISGSHTITKSEAIENIKEYMREDGYSKFEVKIIDRTGINRGEINETDIRA